MTQIKNLVDNLCLNVDKVVETIKNLADFLNSQVGTINEILKKHTEPKITIKPDGSPVTELDLELSSFIESLIKRDYSHVTFYSEEKFSEWKFPMLALDPLDGTREYINGNPEWAVSAGLFENETFMGTGWVYNPVTSELFDHGVVKSFEKKSTYRGEVSRSEWERGLFKSASSEQFKIHPVGSIAYKLGRLSHHKCDFVVSLRPKNIWDIAGGTLLCHQAGMKMYSQGKEVTEVKALYQSPLIWCHPSLFSELALIFP